MEPVPASEGAGCPAASASLEIHGQHAALATAQERYGERVAVSLDHSPVPNAAWRAYWTRVKVGPA